MIFPKAVEFTVHSKIHLNQSVGVTKCLPLESV
jgi:hypothetical protein